MSDRDHCRVEPVCKGNYEPYVPDHTVGAVVTMFLFNFWFGFLAFYFSGLRKEEVLKGNYEEAKCHSRKALILVVIGIWIGLCTYAIGGYLYYVLFHDSTPDIATTTMTTMTTTTSAWFWG